jgi:hypothetical protein
MGVKEKVSKKRKKCYKKHYIVCSIRPSKSALTTEFSTMPMTFILFKKEEQNEGQRCQEKIGTSYYDYPALLVS